MEWRHRGESPREELRLYRLENSPKLALMIGILSQCVLDAHKAQRAGDHRGSYQGQHNSKRNIHQIAGGREVSFRNAVVCGQQSTHPEGERGQEGDQGADRGSQDD